MSIHCGQNGQAALPIRLRQLRLGNQIANLTATTGAAMGALVRELYPLTRSITGPGLRATVQRLSTIVPLKTTEVPTGTPVFDWTVPNEWSIDEAYIEHESGHRFADLHNCNLHVVGYSTPVDVTLTLAELRPHLHSLPQLPELIPFCTSFYTPDWGFCLTDRELQSLPDGQYRVVIRSQLCPGSLTLAEYVHRGASEEEVLVFAHDCHPSLANDNLSGVAVAIHLAAFMAQQRTRYTYRFLFAPTTIGSITWLATNEATLGRIRSGLVLALLGNSAPLHYKKSRAGDRLVDRAAAQVLRTEFQEARLLEFSPWGYDERQFCSPGINLPVGGLTRVPSGEFDLAHTSGDNPDLLSPESLGEAWLACLKIFEAMEADAYYVNLQPRGEPQLGRRGLYRATGGYYAGVADRQMALFWMLNQSDGNASVLDIAEKSGLPVATLAQAATDLQEIGLLGPAPSPNK
jgi:aminopeptidase-like protein